MNKAQKYIFQDDEKWFLKYQPFLHGKILKVGNGFGYSASFIAKANSVTVIDIHKNEQAVNKEVVVIYDGKNFPFKDNTFDCVVCTYVLHHVPNPLQILYEMKRVAKRIIIVEETYENMFAKINLIYRDIFVNFFGGQSVKIYWHSYFKKGNLEKIFEKNNLILIDYQTERRGIYWKELFVLDKM